MSDPTRKTTRVYRTDDLMDQGGDLAPDLAAKLGWDETTEEDLCSVELGATAKGDPQIKSVKVYDRDPAAAAAKALMTFRWLEEQLTPQIGGRHDDRPVETEDDPDIRPAGGGALQDHRAGRGYS